MIRILVAGLLALALPLAASAGAVVESVKGPRGPVKGLTQGVRVVAPTSITTGAGSQVTLSSTTACRSCWARTACCACCTSGMRKRSPGSRGVRAAARRGPGGDRADRRG